MPRLVEVLGFKLNPMEKNEFIDFVAWHIAHKRRALVTHLNMHGLAKLYESRGMTSLMRRPETVVTVDGMSIVLLSWLTRHRLTAKNRVTSLDYIDDMLRRAAERGWNVYYVGGTTEVLSRGLELLRARFPGLKMEGHHGFFDVAADAPGEPGSELLVAINRLKTDLLIVGMGMPRQEEWVEKVRDRIEAPVIITIGAMLEYFAGSLPMPPRWLGPMGLEWAFRLATAPRRLAYRYLIEPFILCGRLLRGRPFDEDTAEVGRRR